MEKIILNLELLQSLVHTEETSSNIANIYRETILKNGKIHKIPAYHGNALRGLLRNLAFENLVTQLGIEPATVPQSIFYILTSGGSLDGSVVGIDIVARRTIRTLLPMLSILGSAMGNEMLQGKLIVSSLFPKCKELGTGELSYWDMTSIIRYTRVDDKKLLGGEKWAKPEGIVDKDAPMQMMYDIEVLNSGVEMDATFYLQDFTEVERSCFFTILEEFSKKPFIGGKSSAGHGQVSILNQIDFEKETKAYKEFLENHKDEIVNYILSYK